MQVYSGLYGDVIRKNKRHPNVTNVTFTSQKYAFLAALRVHYEEVVEILTLVTLVFREGRVYVIGNLL